MYIICVFIYLDEIRKHICIMYVGKQHVIHSQSIDSFGVIAAFHTSIVPFCLAGWIQYLHSLRFILNNPSPPQIAPESGTERLVDIITYVPVLRVRKGFFKPQCFRAMTKASDKDDQ